MRLVFPLFVVVAGLGCASDIKGPGDGASPACTSVDCSDPLPIGDVPPEGEDGGEGEGDVVGGEGEGDAAGEGEGDVVVGEGEGDVVAGEGEGEGDAGSIGALFVSAGPELVNALPSCECDVQNVPASNVDVALVAPSGAQCKKPADQSCGVDGGRCSCGLPGAQWFISRQEEPRGGGEVWPVDEAVNQTSGADGTYVVRASVVDDCLLSPGSTSESTNFACLNLDCEGDFGGAPGCFDYTQLGATCPNAAQVAASEVTSEDCMARGPVPVRVHVEVGGGFSRDFCASLAASGSVDAVQVKKTGAAYTVVGVSSQVHEVAPGAPCP